MSFSRNPIFNNQTSSKRKNYLVALSFLAAGLILGLLLPFLITPRPTSNHLLVPGKIVGFFHEGHTSSIKGYYENYSPVFQFETSRHQLVSVPSAISSSHSSYDLGDEVEIYYDSNNPNLAWIKNDRDLSTMLTILHWFGGFFVIFALIIFGLHRRGVEAYKVERYAGVIGALSFGIPSSLALPVVYLAYLNKPNFLFDEYATSFPQELLFIGGLFTALGLITIAATYLLFKTLSKTSDRSIHISKDF